MLYVLEKGKFQNLKSESNVHLFCICFFLFLKIFMNTLKYLQTHEYLLDVDLWRLFANLDELSQVSQSRKMPVDMF